MEFLFIVYNLAGLILATCQHCLFSTFHAGQAICKCSPVESLVYDEHSCCKHFLIKNRGRDGNKAAGRRVGDYFLLVEGKLLFMFVKPSQ